MNRKKNITALSVTGMLCCTLIITSCRKMLVIPPNAPNQLVTSQVFSDSSAAIGGVVGIYTSNFSSISDLSGYITQYPAMSADELTSTDGDNASVINNALIAGTAQSPGGDTGGIWDDFYGTKAVYQANAAIDGLSKSTALSATLKNQLIGECEVIRAICFFNVANLYGSVPLPRSTDYLVNAKLPRLPVDSAYAQAVRDLLDASKRLTAQYPSSGRARPNKYTALAYLSKVYLYQKNYPAAETTASQIINSGLYSLETLDNVFLDGSNEAIWQAANVGFDPSVTLEGNVFNPYASGVIPSFILTSNLLKAFESGDMRKSSWIDSTAIDGTTYYYPYKYKNSNAGDVTGQEGYMMIRLAEVYLIRAETELQAGELTAAASDINAIRSRAGLQPTNASTKTALMTAIMQERRIELFCEWGNRWYDLKRTGTANMILGQEKPSWPADGHAQLYPVPLDQLKLNPGWKQNPGY